MLLTPITFIKGVIGSEGLPRPPRPTIAFFGRSNVGKSSIVNAIAGERVARANQKPGRTTELNYYALGGETYLVDLPGYGYARLPQALREKIAGYLSWFAADRSIDLRLAVLAVDAEVGPKENDHETWALLHEYGRPILILANKADKANQKILSLNLERFKEAFPGAPLLPFSAKTGKGKAALIQAIEKALATPPASN